MRRFARWKHGCEHFFWQVCTSLSPTSTGDSYAARCHEEGQPSSEWRICSMQKRTAGTLLKLVPLSQSSWLIAFLASTLRAALRGLTKPRLKSSAYAP